MRPGFWDRTSVSVGRSKCSEVLRLLSGDLPASAAPIGVATQAVSPEDRAHQCTLHGDDRADQEAQ